MRARGGLTAWQETLLRGYGDPTATHCALLERRCHGDCFEHGQSARRRSAFYAIAVHLRCHCVAAEMHVIVLRGNLRDLHFLGRHGISVITLLLCDGGLTGSRSAVLALSRGPIQLTLTCK